MSEITIHPSTLDGIKRLAKQLKAQHSTEHHFALDEAARYAGFQSFRHAKKSLSNVKPALSKRKERPTYSVFITVPWRDKATESCGRETLCMELSAPRLDLMSPNDVNKHRAFSDFRNSGPDHLERYYFSDDLPPVAIPFCSSEVRLQG